MVKIYYSVVGSCQYQKYPNGISCVDLGISTPYIGWIGDIGVLDGIWWNLPIRIWYPRVGADDAREYASGKSLIWFDLEGTFTFWSIGFQMDLVG